MTATTCLPGLAKADVSPTLLFHRWQDYDNFEAFKTSESRRFFLLAVADAVQKAGRNTYGPWHETFRQATEEVGVHIFVTASTAWRMVVGWASNPALEAGIVLDHLRGFPLVPGSSVKGLLHHVAEMEIMESADEWVVPGSLPTGGPPVALCTALDAAFLVRILFGSLFLERHRASENQSHGPEVPKERFSHWLALIDREADRDSEVWRDARENLTTVLSQQPIGGMVTCFDAVPSPAEWQNPDKILQPDILNPHYSPYYQPRPGAAALPLDSFSPSPVHFLAVRPGARFEFRVRLAPFPTDAACEQHDPEALMRRHALDGRIRADILRSLEGWLRKGLDEWGLGAKTAAGYGYFDLPDNGDGAGRPAQAAASPRSLEEVATAHLPVGLAPGQLGSVVDAAVGLSAAVQAAVARRLRQYYPKEVASWEKKKDKATVRKRLEWLASVSGGGAG